MNVLGLDSGIFILARQGGHMGKVAKTAASTKLLKLVKIVRMLKLFRIVNVFKTKKTNDTTDSNPVSFLSTFPNDIEPKRMGSLLSNKVTQMVMMGVLVSIVVTTALDIQQDDSGKKTLLGLEGIVWNHFIFSTK